MRRAFVLGKEELIDQARASVGDMVFPYGPIRTLSGEALIPVLNERHRIRYTTLRRPPRKTIGPMTHRNRIIGDHRLIMSGHRRVLALNMNPYHPIANINNSVDLEHSGAVVIHPLRGRKRVLEVHRTRIELPGLWGIGELAEDLQELMALPFEPEVANHPLVIMAARIYHSLHINSSGDVAMFHLSYTDGATGTPRAFLDQTNSTGPYQRAFIRVKMSTNDSIRNPEIFHIANQISEDYTKFFERYSHGVTFEINVENVTVIQHLSLNSGTWDPVITAGPTMEKLELLWRDSRCDTQKRDFLNLYKRLEEKGSKLSSPDTNRNCFVKACFMALNGICWETATPDQKRKLNRESSRKMATIFEKGSYPTLSEFKEAFRNQYFRGKRRIWIKTLSWDTLFVITPPGVNPRMRADKFVVVFGGHAMAVVPKGENEVTEEKPRLIKPYKPNEPFTNLDVGVWDMETTTSVSPYLIGMSIEGGPVRRFFGLECVDAFLRHLLEPREKEFLVLFAHNGGKFDVPLILSKIREHNRWVIFSFLEHNGRILELHMRDSINPDNHVLFRDSFPLLSSSLDNICKLYNVSNPKLGGVDHRAVTDHNWEDEVIRQDLTAYIDNDVLGLQQALTIFGLETKEAVGFDPVRNLIFTSPGIPKRVFLTQGYYDPEKTPLYHLTREVDEYVRNAYHAGRCDVYNRREEENSQLFYFDIVSMYPSIMVDEEMPYGPGELITFEGGRKPEGFYGYVRYMVRGGTVALNGVRIKSHKRGLISPIFTDWTEVTMYTGELDFIIQNNDIFHYEFKFIDGVKFQKANFLREITLFFYEMKKEAKRQGDRVKYNLAKVRLNSIYGHFGFKMWATTLKMFTKTREFAAYLETGHLISIDREFAIVREFQNARLRYVPVAAAITAMAAVKLLGYMIHVKRSGYDMFYCDTDSIVTNCPISVLNEYEQTGSDLGQMDEELPDILKGVFVAPKVYALMTRDGHEHVRIKGVPKGPYLTRVETPGTVTFAGHREKGAELFIGYEDIRGLLDGRSITCKTTRFFSGKRIMLKSGVEIKPHTTVIKGTYLKGVLGLNGFIKPLSGQGDLYE